MDANLAEADMESFRTKDIHALLSNLPPSACHMMQDVSIHIFYFHCKAVMFHSKMLN